MLIKCDLCKKEFNRKPSQVFKRKQHFCSRSCMSKGIIFSDSARKKMSDGAKSLKGSKRSEKARKNIALAKMGDKHPLWKGDSVGYCALHEWIKRNWGVKKLCEICGTTVAKKFEWANLGVYDRDRRNWKRMCCSCHQKYDGKITNLDRYMNKKYKENAIRNKQIKKMLIANNSIEEIATSFKLNVNYLKYYIIPKL
jgi:hypothetical protein